MIATTFRSQYLIVSLTLATLSLPGFAQEADPAELSSLYSSPAFQQSLLQKVGKPTLAAGQRSVLGDSAPPSPAAIRVELPESLTADLHYHAQEGISRTMREQLANRVADADPQQEPEVRSALASGWIWRQFEALLSGLGFSGRNLADVMASYYVGSWQIVHRTIAPPESFRAVRDQLAQSLEHSPEIILMSDAEKQRSSEALGILTTVASNGSAALLQKGDQIGYLAMQSAVYDALLEQGIDLKRLSLGNRGFQPG
jgi:hypothetical protein